MHFSSRFLVRPPRRRERVAAWCSLFVSYLVTFGDRYVWCLFVSTSPAPPFSGGSSASGPPAEPGYLVGGPTSQEGTGDQPGPCSLLRRPPPAPSPSRGVHMTRDGPEGWCVCGEDRARSKDVWKKNCVCADSRVCVLTSPLHQNFIMYSLPPSQRWVGAGAKCFCVLALPRLPPVSGGAKPSPRGRPPGWL